MSPVHHIDDATLAAFSSGAMRMPLSVVVATHLGLCAACRARLLQADAVGGLLVQQQEPAALSAGARDAVLARLDEGAPAPAAPVPTAAAATHDPDVLPTPLQGYFGPRYSTLRWRMLVPGVHRVRAAGQGADGLMLLRIAAGKSMPLHSHAGSEVTLVLKGAYRDELGRFGPGDLVDLDGDTLHRPVTEPGEPCICLAATDAPLRFPGRLARMLQPLFGL